MFLRRSTYITLAVAPAVGAPIIRAITCGPANVVVVGAPFFTAAFAVAVFAIHRAPRSMASNSLCISMWSSSLAASFCYMGCLLTPS